MSDKKTILFVEDESDIREVLGDYIENIEENFEVTFASNGVNGAISCHNSDKFDLIISDQHMPYMDGLSLLKYIRNEDQKNKQTPFLFLSAYIANIRSILDEHENVHFLDKPISFDNFHEKLKELL